MGGASENEPSNAKQARGAHVHTTANRISNFLTGIPAHTIAPHSPLRLREAAHFSNTSQALQSHSFRSADDPSHMSVSLARHTAMKRISVFLTSEQLEALRERAIVTGVSQSEQIRRAISLTLFADAQGHKVERRNGQQP